MTHQEFFKHLMSIREPWYLKDQGFSYVLLRTASSACPLEAVARQVFQDEHLNFHEAISMLKLDAGLACQILGAADMNFLTTIREDLLRSTGFRPIAHLS